MTERKDIAGQRFGRLLVLSYEGTRKGKARWRCRCECGTEHVVFGTSLKRGLCRSCGCLNAEFAAQRRRKHGEAHKTTEYDIWRGMRARCLNPKHKSYPYYGGRGITVCDRWGIYATFLADMGRRPSPEHSIDRWPDNDGGYEPGNCRWATLSEQNLNQRPRRDAG
jgi:hypothetical protein